MLLHIQRSRCRFLTIFWGRADIAFFAAPALAAQYRKNFPARLEGAPFLMPMEKLSVPPNA